MRYESTELVDARQTGLAMHEMVRKYYTDMAPYASLSLPEFFNLMKNLPFNPDPYKKEVIQRPMWTMGRVGLGGDCDDKSIAIASWAKLLKIPYRFVGVGNKKPGNKRILLSHVYPELYIGDKWVPFDATYQFNFLEKTLPNYDRRELL